VRFLFTAQGGAKLGTPPKQYQRDHEQQQGVVGQFEHVPLGPAAVWRLLFADYCRLPSGTHSPAGVEWLGECGERFDAASLRDV
jgi:hypothetical protein